MLAPDQDCDESLPNNTKKGDDYFTRIVYSKRTMLPFLECGKKYLLSLWNGLLKINRNFNS